MRPSGPLRPARRELPDGFVDAVSEDLVAREDGVDLGLGDPFQDARFVRRVGLTIATGLVALGFVLGLVIGRFT